MLRDVPSAAKTALTSFFRSLISFSCLVLSKNTSDWLTLRLAGLFYICARELANEFRGKFKLWFNRFAIVPPDKDELTD